MKYDVIVEDYHPDLIMAVEAKLKQGWKLNGGVTVLNSSSLSGCTYFQSIYKEDTGEIQATVDARETLLRPPSYY